MILYVEAKTKIPGLYIDFIEVELATGEVISLNWDESHIARTHGGFTAKYIGVYLNEEYANGKIRMLEDLKITEVGTYYESEQELDLVIESMEFSDGEWGLMYSNLNYKVRKS